MDDHEASAREEGPAPLPQLPLPLDFQETLPLVGVVLGARAAQAERLDASTLELRDEGALMLYASSSAADRTRARCLGQLGWLGLAAGGRYPEPDSALRNARLVATLIAARAPLRLVPLSGRDDELWLAVDLRVSAGSDSSF